MNRSDYTVKMKSLLEDPAYKKLKRNPTTSVETRISSALKKLEQKRYICLTNNIYFSLLHYPQLHKSMASKKSTMGDPSLTNRLRHQINHPQTSKVAGQDSEHTARNNWFLCEGLHRLHPSHYPDLPWRYWHHKTSSWKYWYSSKTEEFKSSANGMRHSWIGLLLHHFNNL